MLRQTDIHEKFQHSHTYKNTDKRADETVNVWTHLLGAIIFSVLGAIAYSFYEAIIAPRYATATWEDWLVFGCFFAGAFLCLGMSATYHAICNHSPDVAKWGNKLDYTGIVCLIMGSYMPALYYGLYCLPRLLEVYLAMVSSEHTCCDTTQYVDGRTYPAIVCPDFSSTLESTLCIQSLTRVSDLGTRPWVSHRLLVRALPHARVATLPRADVCRFERVRCGSCRSRPDYLRLQRAERAHGAFLGPAAGIAVHFRSFPLCPAMAGKELAKDL